MMAISVVIVFVVFWTGIQGRGPRWNTVCTIQPLSSTENAGNITVRNYCGLGVVWWVSPKEGATVQINFKFRKPFRFCMAPYKSPKLASITQLINGQRYGIIYPANVGDDACFHNYAQQFNVILEAPHNKTKYIDYDYFIEFRYLLESDQYFRG